LRLLICEYVTGGGFLGRPLPASLVREGDMMLAALVKDVAAVGGIEIASVRDWRLHHADLRAAFRTIVAGEDSRLAWRNAIEAVDAVWPIAPETRGALTGLSEPCSPRAARSSDRRAVALATSKLATAEHLAANGIARRADGVGGSGAARRSAGRPRRMGRETR
jgi:predicted ATP-grasp superfamily ATP-dependent carboligase